MVSVSPDALAELLAVGNEIAREQAQRLLSPALAIQRELRRKRRKGTLGARISAVFARAAGVKEDTLSDTVARVLGTTRDGAHVAMVQFFSPIIPPRLVRRGIEAEVASAARKGMDALDLTLAQVEDPELRDRLGALNRQTALRADRRR